MYNNEARRAKYEERLWRIKHNHYSGTMPNDINYKKYNSKKGIIRAWLCGIATLPVMYVVMVIIALL